MPFRLWVEAAEAEATFTQLCGEIYDEPDDPDPRNLLADHLTDVGTWDDLTIDTLRASTEKDDLFLVTIYREVTRPVSGEEDGVEPNPETETMVDAEPRSWEDVWRLLRGEGYHASSSPMTSKTSGNIWFSSEATMNTWGDYVRKSFHVTLADKSPVPGLILWLLARIARVQGVSDH